VPDAILVIAHADSNCKTRLEIYKHSVKTLEIQGNGACEINFQKWLQRQTRNI
jgi:hypothetical protein